MNKQDQTYLSEIAADILASGNPHGDMIEEFRKAHARRQSFASEMRDGSTTRAKMARIALAASVYGQVQASELIGKCMYQCAEVAA